MTTKNIAITEKAYELLVRHKNPSESFSGVIIEHFTKKKHFLDYAGAWSEMPRETIHDITKQVTRAHQGLDVSLRKRIGVLKL
ncbi:MAG TPA: antitoxin VapB family protein [Candidatus Nanoarchaeia archaeon]|nr:antitoxin VapB family protein [Candidatus Nanoarchaeia archaeon]